MKVVYIIGPYRAGTEIALEENITAAADAAKEVWEAGGAALCPHMNSAHFGGLVGDDVFLEGDREMLRRCDAVYVVEGWRRSRGSRTELALAQRLGLPAFYTTNAKALVAFLRG